jgi:ankyrin repeat protein
MAIGSKKILDYVLEDLQADKSSKLQDGNSIMHCAAQFYEGFLPLLVLIKSYNQDVNQKDAQGGSPLHFAVTEGEHKNVELLIRHGADVNLQDEC